MTEPIRIEIDDGPATQKGWSKDDLKVDGVYWWRADANDLEPDIHLVAHGRFYEVAESGYQIVENFGGEWLGPITPADTEQLFALREAAEAVLKLVSGISLDHECKDISHCETCDACEFESVAIQLRSALNTGGSK